MDNDSVREKIVEWNIKFPVDRWWRKKHSVAFNSAAHREISFLDQLFEFEEDKMFNDLDREDSYVPNIGDWLSDGDEEKSQEQLIEEAQREMEDFPNLEE